MSKTQKNDPSSMTGLAADETATTMLTDGEPTNKNYTGEQLEIEVIDEVATISNEAIGAALGTPTPFGEAILAAAETEDARLAAQVEEEEAAARAAKAILRAAAEAQAAQKAEELPNPEVTTEPLAQTFKIINSKFNDRQFGEVLKAHAVLQVTQEQRDELIRLGHPQDGFAAI